MKIRGVSLSGTQLQTSVWNRLWEKQPIDFALQGCPSGKILFHQKKLVLYYD